MGCRSEIAFGAFQQYSYQAQQMPQWCWAACISMLFAYYGHPVAQQRIVAEVYGAPVNMPAVAGIVMATQLNRRWVDDRGNAFGASLSGAYDPQAGVYGLNNAMLVNELDQNRPVIIGAAGHAVVMTAVEFVSTPAGPNITAVGVFDPWPGRGARGLSRAEMMPVHVGGALQFAATARVA
jgi:hypothetical protein